MTDNNTIWIEKYKPDINIIYSDNVQLENLIVDATIMKKIKTIIKEKNMRNIIITGPSGIGKTTTIMCIAKYLLRENINEGLLEVNTSDEKGVKSVQEIIEYFCKKKFSLTNNFQHKIVFLDEADNITEKAQQTINHLMETYNETTRFAFTCNNSSDILEAIQSKCIIFRYTRINNDKVYDRLKYICEKENVIFTKEGLDTITQITQGDLRQAINMLQLIGKYTNNVTVDHVYKLCDVPHPFIIKNIFIECKNKNIKAALTSFNELKNKGYSSSDISVSMVNVLQHMTEIDEDTKIAFSYEICKSCLIISKGLRSNIQLVGCIALLCK